MAEILTVKSKYRYNPRQSKEDSCDIMFPIGIFRDYFSEIFGYCSKHYIFKK